MVNLYLTKTRALDADATALLLNTHVGVTGNYRHTEFGNEFGNAG